MKQEVQVLSPFPVTVLRHGDHACFVYDSDEDQTALLTEFLAQGLATEDRVVYLAEPELARGALSALSDRGIDPGSALREGRLVILEAEAVYLQDGEFDPDAQLSALADAGRDALAAGFRGVRMIADMTWMQRHPVPLPRLLEYEVRGTELLANAPAMGVCQYDRRLVGAELAGELAESHTVVTHRGAPTNHLRISTLPDATGLLVSGELDVSEAPALREALGALANRDSAPEIVLDLAGLRFLDCAGFRVLLQSAGELGPGRTLVLRSPAGLVARLLTLLGAERTPKLTVTS